MILMKDIEYLIGNDSIVRSPLNAYSDEAISFVSSLSEKILKSKMMKSFPDVIALGFWGRKGNLLKLKNNCPEADRRLGRGLCFHIAPSNIPISFAFSFLFGLLAGCSNIVRLPNRNYPQAEAFLGLFKDIIENHPEIKKRSAFIRYPVDNEITQKFSLMADARMIWGGDQTVNSIRSLNVKPNCIDLAFADRYSLAIIDAQSVMDTDESRIARLAEDFYNDTYLMDQNACSSPRIICWLNDNEEGRARFWNAVEQVANKKYHLQEATSVDKYTKSCEDAIDNYNNIIKITHKTNILYRVEVKNFVRGIEEYRGNGGYFYEYSMQSIEDIVPAVTEKFQTITCFGVDPEAIRAVVIKNRILGIDRIAPIGKAMDIGIIWDGYDLVRMLSRLINVE